MPEYDERTLIYKCRDDISNEKPNEMEIFEISLDTDPKDRWKKVVESRKQQLEQLYQFLEDFYGAGNMENLLRIVEESQHIMPDEILQEFVGISEASNQSFNRVLFLNLFYELHALCTSIIVRDPLTRNIFHARNLDFGALMGWNSVDKTWMIPGLLRNLTVHVVWKSNGKIIAESVHFAGYVGVLSGVRKDGFSFSLNSRNPKQNLEDGPKNDFGNISPSIEKMTTLVEMFIHQNPSKAVPSSIFARELLLSNISYEDAKKKLIESPVVIPAYFILAAPKEHASLITRNTTHSRVLELSEDESIPFIVQTNYDYWRPSLFIDDRRTPGIICMRKFMENPKFKDNMKIGLYNVLQTHPMFNQLTTYYAFMSPGTGELLPILEKCEKPCPII